MRADLGIMCQKDKIEDLQSHHQGTHFLVRTNNTHLWSPSLLRT